MPQELTLEEASLVRIHDGRGLLVRALEGALWLTQESDLRDIELSAGQSFRIERNGLTPGARDAAVAHRHRRRPVGGAGHAWAARATEAALHYGRETGRYSGVIVWRHPGRTLVSRKRRWHRTPCRTRSRPC